jgi:hypothetical protein
MGYIEELVSNNRHTPSSDVLSRCIIMAFCLRERGETASVVGKSKPVSVYQNASK